MTVPIDRAATLRQAEKLLRQGKLEQAIAEYLRLVEDQPRDWNTANLLGDLYVRAGHLDRAIEQFSRIAESLRHEGFLPKASALYKKILKLQPEADHALMQAGELAAEQGLLADARTFFNNAAHGRRQRGDSKGALQVLVRIGALDPGDVAARLGGAAARLELDDVTGALHEFNALASMLVETGRDREALDPLRQIVGLDPANAAATKELARILVQEGHTAEAAAFLSPEAIGHDPGLMLVVAEMRIRDGETGVGLELIERLLSLDAGAGPAVTDLALSIADSQPDVAFAVADTVAGAHIESGAWSSAADTLRRFTARVPHHVQALTRLVDVCVDGGLQDDVVDAQGQLADAYLATGAAAEARYVAEDLITRRPWEREHFVRLRSALAAEGQPEPDRALADWLAETSAFGIDDEPFDSGVASSDAPLEPVDVPASRDAGQDAAPVGDPIVPPPSTGLPAELRVAPAQPGSEARGRNPHAIDLDLIFGRAEPPPPREQTGDVEEDLSVALDEMRRPLPPPPSSAGSKAQPPSRPTPAAGDIEAVFAQLRDAAAQRPADEASEVAYTRGTALFEAGELDQSIEQLRLAARSPRRRFASASLLARILQQQKRVDDAVEWLGHAVDAPGISSLERFDTLLRLADLLESTGEVSSALAVCLELQADAGDYRDVNARIARLSSAQGGG